MDIYNNALIIKDNVLISVNEQKLSSLRRGTLILPEGIKKIGKNAFKYVAEYDYEKIKEIILPNTIEEIDDGAFRNLSSLEKINCPSSLKRIGNFTFDSCTSLKEIDLNVGLKEIGNYAFVRCNLQQIYIPSTVTKIGAGILPENKFLGKITVSRDNKIYSDMDCDIIYNKANNTIIQGCLFSEIPQSAKTIANSAFNGILLRNIEIPSNIKNIEDFAFANCMNLQTIILNEGLESIGQYAFARNINIQSINLPSTLNHVEHNIFMNSCVNKIDAKCKMDTIDALFLQPFPKEIKVNNIDNNSLLYLKYKDKIKLGTVDELIEENKSLKEINKLMKEIKTELER